VLDRHDTIRDLLAKLAADMMGVPAHVEQHPPGILPDDRRPDIDYYDKRLVRQYLDVAIVTPYFRALPGSSALHRAGALIEREESNKRRKYHWLSLTPVVLSHLGRLGGGCQSLVKAFACGSSDKERSLTIDGCYQLLACALQRANVALLAAAGPLIL